MVISLLAARATPLAANRTAVATARRLIDLLEGMGRGSLAFSQVRPSTIEFRAFASAGSTTLVGMRQDAIFAGMLKMVHRLLIVIVAFALVGGTSVQLIQSASFGASMVSAGMPCDMMTSMADATTGQTMADDGQGDPMAPCKA
jgi:hypothetical protein